MGNSEELKIEEVIIPLAAVFFGAFVLFPLCLWTAVKEEPRHYQTLGFKDVYKRAIGGLLLSGLVCEVVSFVPGLNSWTLFQIGSLHFKLGFLFNWLAANIFFGSIAYLLLPFWRHLAGKNAQMKDQLY